MAETLVNVDFWSDKYRLAGYMNACAMQYSAEPQDNTRMTQSTRRFLGGMKVAACQIEGFAETVNIDAALFDNVALSGKPVTLSPIMPAVLGSRAFGFVAGMGEYSPTGDVGSILRFSAGFFNSGSPLVRGIIGHVGSESGDGPEDGSQIGALSATQKLYAGLHVLSITGGGDLTVAIESDDASNFPSATQRGAFAAADAAGSEWLSPINGAITDDWWRVNWSLTGTAPTADFVVFLGIA